MQDKKKLYTALHAAKKEFGPLYKTTKGYKSEYETLINVYDLVEPILDKHGLMIDQDMEERNCLDLLVTRIIHLETMQEKRSEFQMVVGGSSGNPKFQDEGAMQTYHRRYQIKLMLGLCAEKDDNDGQPMPKKNYNEPQKKNAQEEEYASPPQVYAIKRFSADIQAKILKDYNVESIESLYKSEASEVISKIKGS